MFQDCFKLSDTGDSSLNQHLPAEWFQ